MNADRLMSREALFEMEADRVSSPVNEVVRVADELQDCVALVLRVMDDDAEAVVSAEYDDDADGVGGCATVAETRCKVRVSLVPSVTEVDAECGGLGECDPGELVLDNESVPLLLVSDGVTDFVKFALEKDGVGDGLTDSDGDRCSVTDDDGVPMELEDVPWGLSDKVGDTVHDEELDISDDIDSAVRVSVEEGGAGVFESLATTEPLTTRASRRVLDFVGVRESSFELDTAV